MNVVIVGASLAGLRTAQALRARGFDKEITLIGEESRPPYDRPPLSKELLAGSAGYEDVQLCGPEELEDLRVVLGRRAVALDAAARVVHLDDGTKVSGDEIVLSTGARPRTIPEFERWDGVHTLRTLDDSLAIGAAMDHGRSVLVIGAGFIGSEVASAARERGLDVTVVEAVPVPLSRVLAPEVGGRLARLHHEGGCDLRCGVTVSGLEGDGGRVASALLSDGSTVRADLVVVGVGSLPNTEWLTGSGIDVTDGVLCDERGRVEGKAHIHAGGDVARWWSRRFADAVRTEHWTAAGDQAEAIAADIIGDPMPEEPLPYVWSDQFGHRIQLAGRMRPTDELSVIRDDEGYVAVSGSGGCLRSVVALDAPREFLRWRRRVSTGEPWEAQVLQSGEMTSRA